MRNRTLFAAFIFLALVAIRLAQPEKAALARSYILPAISSNISVHDGMIALGKAVSGETDYVYVWQRILGRAGAGAQNAAETESVKTPAGSSAVLSPADGLILSNMIQKNLLGYETLAGLPAKGIASAQPGPSPDKSPSPSPSPEPSSEPSASPAASPVPSVSPSPDTSGQNEKVAAFLKQQSAFSDYALPANVSYDTPKLPFTYASPVSGSISSGFGYRMHPIDEQVRFHYGTDFAIVDGSDIHAFAAGDVITVQTFDSYGQTVIIDHGNGYTTLYAHCSQIYVAQGDKVKLGDKIALSGHTGKVTGPHLHFELIHSGTYLNPEFYC